MLEKFQPVEDQIEHLCRRSAPMSPKGVMLEHKALGVQMSYAMQWALPFGDDEIPIHLKGEDAIKAAEAIQEALDELAEKYKVAISPPKFVVRVPE